MTDYEAKLEYSAFTNKALLLAVELMITKQDIREQRELCERMLGFYGFRREEVCEVIMKKEYVEGTARSHLGVVAVK